MSWSGLIAAARGRVSWCVRFGPEQRLKCWQALLLCLSAPAGCQHWLHCAPAPTHHCLQRQQSSTVYKHQPVNTHTPTHPVITTRRRGQELIDWLAVCTVKVKKLKSKWTSSLYFRVNTETRRYKTGTQKYTWTINSKLEVIQSRYVQIHTRFFSTSTKQKFNKMLHQQSAGKVTILECKMWALYASNENTKNTRYTHIFVFSIKNYTILL